MPRNKYPEETVQKILDEALKLFIEKGYEQTTILDIVDNLGGLTRGAFYHHFKSKEEVLDAISSKLFFENNPFAAVKKETGISGLEKIKKMVMRQAKETDIAKIDMALISLLKDPRFLAELVESNRKLLAPMLCELIEEGMDDGSIKKTDAKALSELYMLVVNLWWIPSLYPCNTEEYWNKVLFTKNIFDCIGFHVFDDEVIGHIKNKIINMSE